MTQQQPPSDQDKFVTPTLMHYGAWAGVILGPIALFMPPRRVGFQALLLASGTSYATNILAYDYTGESIYQRFVRRWDNALNGGLPEKAQRTQELLRLERERREAALPEAERRRLQEERLRREQAQRGLLQKLWMGSETDDWRAERARKEKEALDEGRGYGDLIVEQVKEVFSSSDKKDGEEEKKEDAASEGSKKQ